MRGELLTRLARTQADPGLRHANVDAIAGMTALPADEVAARVWA